MIAEMIIGHGKRGPQRVYNLYAYPDEMREALELWGGRLRDIIDTPAVRAASTEASVV